MMLCGAELNSFTLSGRLGGGTISGTSNICGRGGSGTPIGPIGYPTTSGTYFTKELTSGRGYLLAHVGYRHVQAYAQVVEVAENTVARTHFSASSAVRMLLDDSMRVDADLPPRVFDRLRLASSASSCDARELSTSVAHNDWSSAGVHGHISP